MDFRILGPLEVADEGQLLALGGASQRALLALLLLHANEVVSSDRLIDELETKPPGYVLRVEREELDLERFSRLVEEAGAAEPGVAAETLREALALWRGPPLADFAYASFAQASIARIEELRLAALELRIDADLALGRHAALVGELESLVAEQPLRERLHGQLILALYRDGRQADALERYSRARRTLVEGLGLEPSPPLQALEQAVLRHDPELDLTRPERSILVNVRREAMLGPLLGLAETLARRPPKELIVTRLVGGTDELALATATLQERRAAMLGIGLSVRAAAFVSATPAADIVRIAVEQDVDLVLVDGSAELLGDPLLEGLLGSAPCDVAVVVGAEKRPGAVLVPFVGAEHDWAAVELGAWVAGALEVKLVLAGPRESVSGRDSSRLLASASLAVQLTLGVMAEPLLLEPGPEGLLAAAEHAALVVVGLTDRWQKDGLGPVRETLALAARPPVVLVRRGLRPGGLAPKESRTRFTWSIKA